MSTIRKMARPIDLPGRVATPPTDRAPLGATHADLMGGGARAIRFRPERLIAGALNADLSCRFTYEGDRFGPLEVLDVSSTGLGVRADERIPLAPGSRLDELQVLMRGVPFWTGVGAAVYQVDGSPPRLGIRFASGVFDLDRLRLHDTLIDSELERELAQFRKHREELPIEWRAAVSELAHLLDRIRIFLSELEPSHMGPTTWLASYEPALIEAAFSKWGPVFHDQLAELHHLSSQLSADRLSLARAYAGQVIYPLVCECPMHQRAHDKPLGYAGDYRLMTLYFSDRPEGDSIYARFLHHASQRYPLGRTVIGRERTMRDRVAEVLQQADRTSRILSLAAGPAIEIQRLLARIERLEHPLELVMVDQDDEALAHCHAALTRELAFRHQGALPVDLRCLHLSVRQILKPQDHTEGRTVEELLCDLSLVYSAGLFDYLPSAVAKKLIASLYGGLRSGGRLFLGNLRDDGVTTWMMEFVLAWHLEYRTPAAMLQLADGLDPTPARVDVVQDDTGHCLFLDVEHP